MLPGDPETAERRGIFGLETEHAIIYLPDDLEETAAPLPAPKFEVIQRVLFDCLLAGRKAALSSGLKGGYFLENGGLAHVEIYLQTPSDSPILEMATPECRTPWDLAAYSRAYDSILEETSRRSAAVLHALGHSGRIVFGKNNVDAQGVGFGCHENYLVHSKPDASAYLVSAAAFPFLVLAFLPTMLLILCIIGLALGAFLAIKLLEHVFPSILSLIWRVYDGVLRTIPGLAGLVRVFYFVFTNMLLYPAIIVYSLLLRRIAFRRFLLGLTPFLATRPIIAGAGCLDFRRGAYALSQRARLTWTLAEIVMFARWKTIFDLKAFLFDPLALFRPTKKLTLACGDSNLSDTSNVLKLGATALIIEMIEAGETFEDLRLVRPVRAFRMVSTHGPWKQLRLRSGKSQSAIEIQRAYLDRARAYFSRRPEGKLRQREILAEWARALEGLERPQSLAPTLDWAAKKAILDRAVLPKTNWKVFFAWGKLFDAAGLEASASATGIGDLLARTPLLRRLRARALTSQAEIHPADFELQQELHFQAQKIDFRFHELGGGTGYQRRLETEGLVHRILDDSFVEKAMREPPPDTRARVRAYYIQRSSKPEALQVSWNEVELLSPLRHIPTPDPFHHRLPAE